MRDPVKLVSWFMTFLKQFLCKCIYLLLSRVLGEPQSTQQRNIRSPKKVMNNICLVQGKRNNMVFVFVVKLAVDIILHKMIM